MDAKKGLWGTLKRYGLLMLGMLGVIYFAIAVGCWGIYFWAIVVDEESWLPIDWPMFWHAVPAVVFLVAFCIILRRLAKDRFHSGRVLLIVLALSMLCSTIEITFGWYQLSSMLDSEKYYFTWWHTLCSESLWDYNIDSGFGVIDTEGKYIVEPKYDWIRSFHNGYAQFSINDNFGFLDTQGQVAIALEYVDAGEFSEGLAAVAIENEEENRLWGYINESGQMVIEPQFTSAEPFNEGLAAVSLPYIQKKETDSAIGCFPGGIPPGGEIWGFIDKTGKMVIEPKYYQVWSFSQGLAAVGESISDEGRSYYLTHDGNVAFPESFANAYPFFEGFARIENLSGKYCFIDQEGRRIGDYVYDDARNFSEHFAAVKINGKYGFIAEDGTWTIKPQFDGAGDFHNGLAPAQAGELWGYIASNGNWVIHPQYSFASVFSEGMAYCETNNRRMGYRHSMRSLYINTAGKILLDVPGEYFGDFGCCVMNFREGCFSWKTPVNNRAAFFLDGKWGYIDNIGNIVIEPKFDAARQFHEERAVVYMEQGELYDLTYDAGPFFDFIQEYPAFTWCYGLAVLGLTGAIVLIKTPYWPATCLAFKKSRWYLLALVIWCGCFALGWYVFGRVGMYFDFVVWIGLLPLMVCGYLVLRKIQHREYKR